MANNNPLLEIKNYGQSVWMDNLSRSLIESIDLNEVMQELLEAGIDKFVQPFDSLAQTLEAKVKQLAAA